ncbi:MAG: hypothetical protein GTO02_14220 [Candidatus Dadabacteria bacterium]|nr:hypothetical protein [Candidatus Dadabacteria bacterium]
MRSLVLVLAMGVSGVSLGTETEKKNKVTITQSSYSSVSATDNFEQSSSHFTIAYERQVNKVLSLGVSIGSGESSYTGEYGYGSTSSGSASFQLGLAW